MIVAPHFHPIHCIAGPVKRALRRTAGVDAIPAGRRRVPCTKGNDSEAETLCGSAPKSGDDPQRGSETPHAKPSCCRRAFKIDQPCALNFDQGLLPARHGLACGYSPRVSISLSSVSAPTDRRSFRKRAIGGIYSIGGFDLISGNATAITRRITRLYVSSDSLSSTPLNTSLVRCWFKEKR